MNRIDLLKILMNHEEQSRVRTLPLACPGCSHATWADTAPSFCFGWGNRLGLALLQDFGGFVANWCGLAQGSCTNWSSDTKWTVLGLSICSKKMVHLNSFFLQPIFWGRKILGILGKLFGVCAIFPTKKNTKSFISFSSCDLGGGNSKVFLCSPRNPGKNDP